MLPRNVTFNKTIPARDENASLPFFLFHIFVRLLASADCGYLGRSTTSRLPCFILYSTVTDFTIDFMFYSCLALRFCNVRCTTNQMYTNKNTLLLLLLLLLLCSLQRGGGASPWITKFTKYSHLTSERLDQKIIPRMLQCAPTRSFKRIIFMQRLSERFRMNEST